MCIRDRVEQDAQLNAVKHHIPLAVGEDDVRGLAAQLQRGRDKALGRCASAVSYTHLHTVLCTDYRGRCEEGWDQTGRTESFCRNIRRRAVDAEHALSLIHI